MLAYFPTLYEDELLYSGIARFHMNSGNITQRQTIEDLFGDSLVCAVTDLPSHLEALVSKIDKHYSSEQLIRNHTLFPYYTYFYSQSKIDHVEMLMKKGAAQGAIHSNLGLLASKVKVSKYLKFCRECYRADAEKYEPYWHRSHQLPGVSICSLHKQPLVISNVECGTENHKFEFVALSKIKEDCFEEVNIDPSWTENLIYIAEQSVSMLLSSCLRKNDFPEYKGLLYEQRYLTPKGRVKFERLIHNLRLFYSDGLLQHLNCEVNGASETWLHKIIRTPVEIMHPLRHLLIMKFLGGTPDSSPRLLNSPFGDGPWPCLNKTAEHYHLHVIEKCEISRCTKTGRPVGTFQCSCGFVYSRRGPDQSYKDKYRVGRIKDFGQIWYERLTEVNRTNVSLRQKARILGVDPGTIKNQTAVLLRGPKVPCKNELIASKGSKSFKAMKSSVQRLQKARVDWDARDEAMLDVVGRAIEEIMSLLKPHRITLASIARTSVAEDSSVLLLKNINKLPKTKNYTKSCLDTTESYQIRRLVWAADKLVEVEGKIVEWKLMKLAGLNHPLRKQVTEVFNHLTRPINFYTERK